MTLTLDKTAAALGWVSSGGLWPHRTSCHHLCLGFAHQGPGNHSPTAGRTHLCSLLFLQPRDGGHTPQPGTWGPFMASLEWSTQPHPVPPACPPLPVLPISGLLLTLTALPVCISLTDWMHLPTVVSGSLRSGNRTVMFRGFSLTLRDGFPKEGKAMGPLYYCYGLNVCIPPDLYVEASPLTCWHLEMGPFRGN